MSNEAKWAPAPWRIVNHGGPVDELGPGSDWSVMCADDFAVCFEGTAIESNAANAHLIAAAPRMYQQLEASNAAINAALDSLPDHAREHMLDVLDENHEVLAKAKGET